MSDQHRGSAAPVEPYFDRTPQPFGDGPPARLVYDASPRALRQRTVNFAAKRLVDMRYFSGLDRATAERHFRWRPAVAPGGLGFRAAPAGQTELAAAQRRNDIVIDMDDADRRVVVHWNNSGFGEPVIGAAVAWPGYGGSVLGPHASLQFDPQPISRRRLEPGRAWPLGDAVETPPATLVEVDRALDASERVLRTAPGYSRRIMRQLAADRSGHDQISLPRPEMTRKIAPSTPGNPENVG